MKNTNKLFVTGILTVMLSCPVFADNEQANITNENKGCTSGTLTVDSGTAALEADWQANTVGVTFYNGDTQYSSGQCTYDGTLTLPSTDPTKDGYTFSGWTVRRASATPAQTTITLSSLYDSGDITIFSSKSLNPGVACIGSSGYETYWDEEEEAYMGDYIWYGTDYGGSCSDSAFNGLNNGEWKVEMPNGNKVKGIATCSTTSGNNHNWQWGGNSVDWSLASNELDAGQYSVDNSSGLRYCWCKVTSGDTGNGYQHVASSSWVFNYGDNSADGCALDCANRCAYFVFDFAVFRRAVFGVSQ